MRLRVGGWYWDNSSLPSFPLSTRTASIIRFVSTTHPPNRTSHNITFNLFSFHLSRVRNFHCFPFSYCSLPLTAMRKLTSGESCSKVAGNSCHFLATDFQKVAENSTFEQLNAKKWKKIPLFWNLVPKSGRKSQPLLPLPPPRASKM